MRFETQNEAARTRSYAQSCVKYPHSQTPSPKSHFAGRSDSKTKASDADTTFVNVAQPAFGQRASTAHTWS